MELRASYLESIQALPGDTPGEKQKRLATFIRNNIKANNNVEFTESPEIPQALLPLVQIEAAKILKKHDVVTECLKSDDAFIVNRALQASWYFNGSVKDVVNVEYFKRHLLPAVSLNTRYKLVKFLALQLCGRDQLLAEELFQTITSIYGVKEALPLLTACSESFAYEAILEHKLVLPRQILKKIYWRNPNLLIRYLKLSKPDEDRRHHSIALTNYVDFLQKLVKKHLDAFVEIYEMHEKSPPRILLSNKAAEAFLKNGKDHLLRKPLLYIEILPLKLIGVDLIEALLPMILPKRDDFNVDRILDYLQYYPKEGKVLLLKKVFKEVYNEELLANSSTVKPRLLCILPAEERIEQARLKLENENRPATQSYYKEVWRCYLPTEESIPLIKAEIAVESDMNLRAKLLLQLIYTCKVNHDENAFLEVLKYFQIRHKNEQSWLHLTFFSDILEQYNILNLTESHWSVLDDLIRRCYVKNDFVHAGRTVDQLLEDAVHYKLLHALPIDEIIGMFVDTKIRTWNKTWNIILKKPEYERQSLVACLNFVSKKINDKNGLWEENKIRILIELVESIYDFNTRHTKAPSRVERMSIKNYPWLLNAVKEVIDKENEQSYTTAHLLELLAQNEKDLYSTWIRIKEPLPHIRTGAALQILKKNPQFILENWQEYLKMCKCGINEKRVIRFLKAVRWYKDIPMKFFKQCMHDLSAEKDTPALFVLAVLLDGHIFTTLIDQYVPKSKTIDASHKDAKQNYEMVHELPRCINVGNPPVSLSLIARFCDGDYLTEALACLTNICRRIPVPEVIVFAKSLINNRVSLRKHGIRILCTVETLEELSKFLLTQWKIEENKSIREILFKNINNMFYNNPGPVGWCLIKDCISALTIKDTDAVWTIISNLRTVNVHYVKDYVTLLVKIIDDFAEKGFQKSNIMEYMNSLLSTIDSYTCNLLSEELCADLLKRYLFDFDAVLTRTASSFTIFTYLCTEDSKLGTRMATVCRVFREKVEAHWDQPHPRKLYHYPVNYEVRNFVHSLVRQTTTGRLKPYIIESFLKAFVSVLTPQQEANSYLLLLYAKEQMQSQTPKEFGRRISQRLPELIQTFSPLFITLMSKPLLYILSNNSFESMTTEQITLDTIEGLMESRDIHTYLFCTGLLSPLKSRDCIEQYKRIITGLRDCSDTLVSSIIRSKMNGFSYDESFCEEDE